MCEEINKEKFEIINISPSYVTVKCKFCKSIYNNRSLSKIKRDRFFSCKQSDCPNNVRVKTELFINNLKNRGIYDTIDIITPYRGIRHPMTVRYKACGHEVEKTGETVLDGYPCIICNNTKFKLEKYEDYVEKISKLDNFDDYILTGMDSDFTGSTTKFIFVHSKCNMEYINTWNNIRIGCRCKCGNNSDSHGVILIKDFLNKNRIEYEQEKRFDDCRLVKPLPFDFFIPDLNIAIEFDGNHHFYPVYGPDRLEKTRQADLIKDIYCKDNEIHLIRIPYTESGQIDTILNTKFNNVQRLSQPGVGSSDPIQETPL